MTYRTHITHIFSLLGMGLLAACLSPRPDATQELVEVSEAVKATPRYQQARDFDAWLKDELSPERTQEWKADCKRDPKGLFCPSLAREKKLKKYAQKLDTPAKAPVRRETQPITPVLKGERIQNWSQVRKANLRGLLLGMRAFSLEELKTSGRYAMRRGGCPNQVTIASAALLEIHLPYENVSAEIAKLYERAAQCTRRSSRNYEHFMTRAALFLILEKNYPRAERLLTKVRSRDAYSGRPLYWLHRVQLLMGKKSQAQLTLEKLLKFYPLSFHALMAASSKNTRLLNEPGPDAIPTRSKHSALTNQFIEQCEALREMGFLDSAAKLVSFTLSHHGPKEAPVRAYLSSLGSPTTQVRTVGSLLLVRPELRAQAFMEIAYPKSYYELFQAKGRGVDPYLLLAIARKESHLDPTAVSPANAQGLLQLNPDTARRLDNSPNLDLFDAGTNTALAGRYINELEKLMKGQLPLIIASYNAGEQAVASWTQRYPTTDLLLFVDLIPYRETRDYVGFVLANYYWYRTLYADNAQQALASLTSGELAKVDEPRGVRSVQSLVDQALKTSEQWPEESSTVPFVDRWKSINSVDEAL